MVSAGGAPPATHLLPGHCLLSPQRASVRIQPKLLNSQTLENFFQNLARAFKLTVLRELSPEPSSSSKPQTSECFRRKPTRDLKHTNQGMLAQEPSLSPYKLANLGVLSAKNQHDSQTHKPHQSAYTGTQTELLNSRTSGSEFLRLKPARTLKLTNPGVLTLEPSLR